MKIIALEEGYLIQNAMEIFFASSDKNDKYTFKTSENIIGGNVLDAYLDMGEGRIAAMDDSGIDMQVLSYSGSQIIDPETALRIMMEADDAATEAINEYPDRFAAFTALQMVDPEAAVREFERTLNIPGFVGGFICGTIGGEFLDDRKYWPIFECAQAHNAPIYLHPFNPLSAFTNSYLKGHAELMAPVWGFMVDAGTHFMRLLTSGVFDAFPNLKIILGHLGESIPYNLDRINNRLSVFAKENLKRSAADYIRDNLVVTTSGNFQFQSLLCAVNTLGVDNVLFSADWPNESNKEAVDFLMHLPVGSNDIEKIAFKNAERVLGLK